MSKTEERIWRVFQDGASEHGIEITSHHLDLFRIYLYEIRDWNRHINLTGLSEIERIVTELFLDSLIPAPNLPARGRMLDVGSGAGIPGVPLKICKPDLRIDLLEPHSKKVSFLRQITRLLNLKDIWIIRGRIERDQALLDPAGYDVISSRALAGLDQITGWCTPFLKPGGLLVGFLGSGGDKEIERTRRIFEQQGLAPLRIKAYILPGGKTERTSIILKKREEDPEGNRVLEEIIP